MTDESSYSNDCDFTVSLGASFNAKRMVLGAIAIENYLLNIGDLSMTVDGVEYTIIP